MSEFERVHRDAERAESARQARGRELVGRTIPATLHDLDAAAPHFVLDERLARALNVALAVGSPLLLTGEPGTGKTQVAYYLKWYFGIDDPNQPLRLSVKSTTTASDLLYTFDHVAYFRESQRAAHREAAKLEVDAQAAAKDRFLTKGPLWLARDAAEEDRPAVVLIDEIDKAPRDFPNDVLHELDQFSFRVAELDQQHAWPEGKAKPVVIITSNSERRLPEPFLRRCIFHHLEFDHEVVKEAVRRRASDYPRLSDDDLAAAVEALLRLREVSNLRHKPSLGSLFTWMVALDRAGASPRLAAGARLASLPLLHALIKDRDDLEALARV